MSKPRRKKYPEGLHEAFITKLSHDGRGIAFINNKITFIDNALPGESVQFRYSAAFSRFNEGVAEKILIASPERAVPKCQYFAICGGCSLQHLSGGSQRKLKQQTLIEQFEHFGKTQIPVVLEPLQANEWGYRRKARLSVRYIEKKQRVLVGFREKRSNYIADIDYCEVLHPNAAKLIAPLKDFLLTLDSFKDIPQIEVAVDKEHVALVFRHMVPLSSSDLVKLKQFAKSYNIYLYLQPNGVESINLVFPENTPALLQYELLDYRIRQAFMPSDFAQVNFELNTQMINRAIEFLALESSDTVLDLFCGFGNFTLPIARFCAHVVGIEGSNTAIERAKYNATLNNINNVEFFCANLDTAFDHFPWANLRFTKILLDPSRSGAKFCISQIERFQASKIVYISCNPATLARDTSILIEKGYKLTKAGIMDMFPHTNHVESIAVFESIK